MRPINARSRNPTSVLVSMLSSSRCASSGGKTGVLPFFTSWCGTAYGRSRIDWRHLADDKPIEKVTDRGKPRLDRWVGEAALYKCRHEPVAWHRRGIPLWHFAYDRRVFVITLEAEGLYLVAKQPIQASIQAW
jgi:hypothetical protein